MACRATNIRQIILNLEGMNSIESCDTDESLQELVCDIISEGSKEEKM